jgi:hypothetical protein
LSPTFGRMNIGPTTAATNGNDVAWLYSGNRNSATGLTKADQMCHEGCH